tara:strand:+ start:336 stop:545 length:210 start_codon:yes stop_codon:yes gene_type:complete
MQSIKEDKEICPTCSSSNTRIIVYGLVIGQDLRDKTKYHFAGCMFDCFKFICYDCDVMWGDIWENYNDK